MEEFLFTKGNDKKVLIPDTFDKDELSIPGVFLTSSIRFYKHRLDTIDKSSLNSLKLSNTNLRKLIRIIHASMADFKYKDGYVHLTKTNTNQDKDYDFKDGYIIVKCDKFIDIVEKQKIESYLDEYGFDENKKDEILINDETSLNRIPGKKLKYFFNY